MNREILENIIEEFNIDKFVRFFREKNRAFAPRQEELAQDGNFTNGLKLGEIRLADDFLIICSFEVNQALTEKSGKKAQYEKGKAILKEHQEYTAGIFIFYDQNGNFRFSLIYDIPLGNKRDWSAFRRFTYFVSKEFTNKTFLQRIGESDFSSLEKIKDAFSVEKVTKEFYEDIANWYFWAVKYCCFPKDAELEKDGRNIAVIRLITRMIFIWFMREQGLVPKELFKESSICEILEDVSSEGSTYYQAILQNLFFATLNTKQKERQFRSETIGHKGYNLDFGNQYVYRYHKLFKNSERIKDYFSEIPFLNGGLFECFDDKPNSIYIDGFTETKKHQPVVPNFLFFSKEQKVDLNADYGTKNKDYKVIGLLDILSSFNFTIDENSPDDADVALDPELLGRVFENLLASFNPETSTTARKATGSYYTPREIVDYMVIESLKAYFKTHLDNIEKIDEKMRNLFSIGGENNPFDEQESKKLVELIENVKIVDPAVGSGAFPMGVLNKLVFVLNKVDSGNELWKQAQLKVADMIPDMIIRRDTRLRIEEFFKDKNADYGRKLYLIQRCIYGVDIQQIAVEIAKLRFFISLLVDEKIDKNKKNWGIEPLPNLDFKIMQGNSLISEFMGIDLDAGSTDCSQNQYINIDEKVVFLKKRQQKLSDEYIKLYNTNNLSNEEKVRTENELGEIAKKLKMIEKEKQHARGDKKEDDEIVSLISRFEQKKVDFQNESDKDKKTTLKTEIEDLMIEMFETKVKKQKADYFRQISEIEQRYSGFSDKKTREENIAREKQNLSQKTGFDLEDIEKQLREFTGKKKTRPFFPWKLYFAEVFEKGGFDVVIGNPPYVRQEDIKEYKPLFEKAGYQVYNSTSDLYTYFYELSYNLLASKGFSCFISSNKWMRAKYGEKLRNFFKTKTRVMELIDFGGHQVFDATVDTNIMLFQKCEPQKEYKMPFVNIESDWTGVNLGGYVCQKQQTIKQMELAGSGWTLADDKVLGLKKKIEKVGTLLKDWDVKINYGIKTGFNEAFIIDTPTKERLCQENPKSAEILKPILRGRNIGRYYYRWAGLWLIKIESRWTNKNRGTKNPEMFFKETYPAIYHHLKSMGEKQGKGKGLYQRDDQGDYWWELRDCDYYGEFEKEKIVYPEFSTEGNFVYDNQFYFTNDTGWSLVCKSPKYINGILNSKLVWFFLNQVSANLSENAFRMKKIYLELLPIPKLPDSEQKPFIELVNRILAAKKLDPEADTTALEREIDRMVYKLYSLTEEEIKIVEENLKRG